MPNFSFHILNDKENQVEMTYGDKTLNFELSVKRSFTVLKKLLEAYPKFINIHSLDSILNDPNRAESDLKIANGFAHFLKEKRGKKRVIYVKLDVVKLFNVFKGADSNKFLNLSPAYTRSNLTEKEKDGIYQKFNGTCNITGLKVFKKLEGSKFFKHALLATYDHRRPLSKGGSDELSNIQLISQLANDEKNKICNVCDGKKCEQCALAYPEKFDIIIPTGQNIKEIFKKKQIG